PLLPTHYRPVPLELRTAAAALDPRSPDALFERVDLDEVGEMVVAAPLAEAERPAGKELHGLALEGAEQEVDVVGRPGLARAGVAVLRRAGNEALAQRAQRAHLGGAQEEPGSFRALRPSQPFGQRLPGKQGQEREVPPHAQELAAPE